MKNNTLRNKLNKRTKKISASEIKSLSMSMFLHITRVYPKVSGLAAWSENSKWYSSLPLGAFI
jgi:hypothetical protein